MPFIHLHNHSHYSLLDGLLKFDEIIEFSKSENVKAAAITDHGALYGAIEFYQKCKKEGIKPIIGVETYLAPESRFNKSTKFDAYNYHLLLLVKDYQGYKNLLKLVSASYLEGFYYKPRIDWELLEKYHEGLIASTACLGGEIPQLILSDKLEKAEQRILEYNTLFGQDNFYLEIMDHKNLEGQEKVNEALINFSKKLNVPLLATNDAHYLNKDDDKVQDILLCLQNKKKLEDDNRMKMIGMGDFSLRPSKEIEAAFSHVKEAVLNTEKIAKMCNLEIPLGEIKLPHFSVKEGYDGNSYLKFLCYQNLEKYYGFKEVDNKFKITDKSKLIGLSIEEVIDRLDYELSVIAKMGWPAYFLIVADFVVWAKSKKIVVGPGRGSAAGSIVCYLTGITNIDPLKYELLFERFLNPERVSMPDIDLDFADTRRDEVISYVEEKYGKDHVAQIITFGTMAARAAVRDVGRVLNAPYDFCDKLSKMIPMFTSLNKALETVPELIEIYKNDDMAKEIIDYAKRLEGVARHTSTHACGVLITPEPLTEYTPVQYASAFDKSVISQYSLHPVEDLGLLKMDFLGLKNLSIIESAINIIKNTRGIEIDIEKIKLDDTIVYKLFQKGQTTGIFQFESSGMKRYLRELKPNEFEDIIAMVALYRPGPMEWIADYIAGKHKLKKVAYLHPKLEKILDKTYGVAIYQEQIMQIARDLAGFSMGQADILRKAVGKKIPELLAKQKEKFIEGCVKNGIFKDLAEKIFSFIEPFAGYGFNRSHAACYALIAYQTAYLKAHFPVEFMAALLSADLNDSDRIAIEIDECRKMGFKVMPPDINESFASFTVVTSKTKENKVVDKDEKVDTIRFGLKAIKNVGEHIVLEIIKERKENGPFLDIFDFLTRILDKDLNKKSLESLIKSGAFNSFGEKELFLNNLEKLLSYNKNISKELNSKQSSLFENLNEFDKHSKPKLEAGKKIPEIEKINWERELLGLYISSHPLSIFDDLLNNFNYKISSLTIDHKDSVIIAGAIVSIKKITTRKNETMLFVKIEDQSASIETLVFPKLYKAEPEIWQEGNIIIASGKLSKKDRDLKLLLNTASILDVEAKESSIDNFKKKLMDYNQNNNSNQKKYYKFNNNNIEKKEKVVEKKQEIKKLKIVVLKNLSNNCFNKLKDIFKNYPGNDPVDIKLILNGKARVLKTDILVDNNKFLQSNLINEFNNKIIIL